MAGWVDGKTFSALLKTLQRDQTLSKEPTVFWDCEGDDGGDKKINLA